MSPPQGLCPCHVPFLDHVLRTSEWLTLELCKYQLQVQCLRGLPYLDTQSVGDLYLHNILSISLIVFIRALFFLIYTLLIVNNYCLNSFPHENKNYKAVRKLFFFFLVMLRHYIILDYIPHIVHFISMTHSFCIWNVIPFNLLQIYIASLHSFPLCLSLYLWLYFWLVIFICFVFRVHIQVKSYIICLSLT